MKVRQLLCSLGIHKYKVVSADSHLSMVTAQCVHRKKIKPIMHYRGEYE